MYAIIETGGKQYRVSAGDLLQVEIGEGMAPDATVRFDRVLFLSDGSDIRIGTPTVAEASVEGTILRMDRAPKVLVFKKKRRKQYRRTRGHRQEYAEVRIDALVLPGGKRHEAPAEKKAKKAPKAEKAKAPEGAAAKPAKSKRSGPTARPSRKTAGGAGAAAPKKTAAPRKTAAPGRTRKARKTE